jgi:hypothetical protein
LSKQQHQQQNQRKGLGEDALDSSHAFMSQMLNAAADEFLSVHLMPWCCCAPSSLLLQVTESGHYHLSRHAILLLAVLLLLVVVLLQALTVDVVLEQQGQVIH